MAGSSKPRWKVALESRAQGGEGHENIVAPKEKQREPVRKVSKGLSQNEMGQHGSCRGGRASTAES